MDRFAEKYYSQSPYQYAANNPIRNIDVNGDTIVIYVPKDDGKDIEELVYKPSEDGKSGFYDKDGNPYSGNDLFTQELTEALAELRKGKTGKALVDGLANNKRRMIIRQIKEGGNFADNSPFGVGWNPSAKNGGLDQSGKTRRPSFIGLGHELAHIQDIWQGTYDSDTWFKFNGENIPNAEKYATHIENKLRAEHNLPLRTYYTNIKESKARLLVPGTNKSLFYKQMKKIENRLIPTTPYMY